MPASVCVWIGPEGDFTPAEINAIKTEGALPITLGRLVLRSETAAVYCFLSQLRTPIIRVTTAFLGNQLVTSDCFYHSFAKQMLAYEKMVMGFLFFLWGRSVSQQITPITYGCSRLEERMSHPVGDLIEGSDGKLYGTTRRRLNNGVSEWNGVVFSLNKTAAVSACASFAATVR
jgi:hypothetical protein